MKIAKNDAEWRPKIAWRRGMETRRRIRVENHLSYSTRPQKSRMDESTVKSILTSSGKYCWVMTSAWTNQKQLLYMHLLLLRPVRSIRLSLVKFLKLILLLPLPVLVESNTRTHLRVTLYTGWNPNRHTLQILPRLPNTLQLSRNQRPRVPC